MNESLIIKQLKQPEHCLPQYSSVSPSFTTPVDALAATANVANVAGVYDAIISIRRTTCSGVGLVKPIKVCAEPRLHTEVWHQDSSSQLLQVGCC